MTRAAVLLVLLASAGCARPRPSPFGSGEGSAGPAAGDRHTVRFQASCDECVVTWSVGGRGGSVQDRALFSRSESLRLRPGETVQATLSASPVRGAVNWVRISFEGKVAAEARADDGGANPTGGLSVQALLEAPQG